MEAALSRTATSRLPLPIRLEGRLVWIWALCAGSVLYLGLDGGGYDLVVRSDVGVVVWWIVLVGALFGVLPAARLSRASWAAVALLACFLVWSAIASGWSLSSERTLGEVSRLAAYLGILVAAVLTYGDRRRALAHVVAAVAAAIALIVILALLSRLRPGTFAGATTTAALLPGAQGRLSWPLNYWNALGALVALELPLLLSIATSARRLLTQAAAAAAIPLTALCGYLTFSRGGAIAAAVGLIVFLALAPERIPKLATLLVSAAGSAALIAGAVHRHAIEQGLTDATARHQGSTLIVAVILVCGGVGLMQVGIGLAARHGKLPRLLRISPGRARLLLAAALLAAIAAAVALHGPARLDHAWHQFKQNEAASLHQNALGRFGSLSGNGRYAYWKTAVHAMPGHWLRGWGPGTFQLVWLPRASRPDYVVNAHSLYFETLSDVGIVGLVLLVCFLVAVALGAILGVVRSRFERRAQVAAVAAVTFVFLTSAAFDWVWQVPVLPVAWLLLAAAALAPGPALHVPGQRPDRALEPAPWRLWGARAVTAAVAIACLIAIGIPLAATTAVRSSQAAAAAHNDTAALADAQSALRIEPAAASAALQAALVLEQQRRFAGAAAEARIATKDEPANWQTWLVRSRLEAEAGHPRLAVAAFRRARALNPRSAIFGA